MQSSSWNLDEYKSTWAMRKLRFTPVIQVKNSQQAELIQNIKFFLVHLLFTDTCSAYFCCYSLFRKNALRKKLMAMQKKKKKDSACFSYILSCLPLPRWNIYRYKHAGSSCSVLDKKHKKFITLSQWFIFSCH